MNLLPDRPIHRIRFPGLLLFLLGTILPVQAQETVIPLWPGAAPGSEDWSHAEQEGINRWDGYRLARNVTTPTLTVFRPDPARANGTAMIVAPGGGFHFLSMETEGTMMARWLAAQGVTAFVLKYRLVPTAADDEVFWAQMVRLFSGDRSAQAEMARIQPLAIEDGRQAVRLVRQQAATWGIDPHRIGLMGFSAGGMVTAGVALEHDADSRPDFIAPIYGAPFEPVHVPADAPPMFILVASDDPLLSTQCVTFYQAWKTAGKEAELHVYAKGGHGFGMKQQNLPIDTWPDRLADWMRTQGLLRTTAP